LQAGKGRGQTLTNLKEQILLVKLAKIKMFVDF
jgi:hypothetical protein